MQIDTITDKISLPRTSSTAISLPHFSIILKALISNTSRLDNRACNNMVLAILRYDWLDKGNTSDGEYSIFADLYSHFLSVLVSTMPKFLTEVMNKLVREFESISSLQDNSKYHHIVLQKILKYIPTSINSLPQILQSNFPPHFSSSTVEVMNYVDNLLRIVDYAPELQFSVWQLIIECCIKLDVELQNELDDLDDDEIEQLIQGKEEDMELLEDSDNGGEEEEEEGEEEEEDNDDEEQRDEEDLEKDNLEENEDDNVADGEVEWVDPENSTQRIKMLSSKLDNIVQFLLTKTAPSFTNEEISNGNGVTLFNTINSLFKSHILPTHFTKLIQFLLFHITQFQPELADSFLVLLIDVAFNPSEILEKRLKAMQYLSSYIARAKNLSRHQIVFIVSYLMGWINKYIMEREQEALEFQNNKNKTTSRNDNRNHNTNQSQQQTGGMERFKLFYSAFQALLYIFCFRHETLRKQNTAVGSSNSEWECEIDKFFQRVIIAKFNPLKFCDETVVYIFAKLATKLNVCYCYSIIEHNKRERILQTNGTLAMPSAVANFKQKQEFLDLEAYFPFDPLVLPLSKRIVRVNFVEWSEVNPEEEDDEDSGSGSHIDDDDEEEDEEEDEEDEEDDGDSSSDEEDDDEASDDDSMNEDD